MDLFFRKIDFLVLSLFILILVVWMFFRVLFKTPTVIRLMSWFLTVLAQGSRLFICFRGVRVGLFLLLGSSFALRCGLSSRG
jgi:hypothetical protein